MATPHVAGAAALLFTQKPTLTPAGAKSLLLANVDQLGSWTGVVASGGRLNVYGAALAASGDLPPTVSLTAPANGATVPAGTLVTVSADAHDGDGDATIARVDFYANGGLIGSDTTAPYSVSWTSVTAGTYTLTATAVDNMGATGTSAARTLTVSGGAGSSQTLLTTQVPAGTFNDGVPYELGVRIVPDVAGQFTAVRFWKMANETATTHVGHIWSAAGQLLATVTFTNESASGWQTQASATPLAVNANVEYVDQRQHRKLLSGYPERVRRRAGQWPPARR